MAPYTIAEVTDLVARALYHAPHRPDIAVLVASALVRAEIDGKSGHGLARVESYAMQARAGKVDGFARVAVTQPKPAMLAVDAGGGFAYAALYEAVKQLPPIAEKARHRRRRHLSLASLRVAGHHVEAAAEQGMIALLFANTPAALAPWGGRTPLFGTNPIAFAAPIKGDAPLVIDLATSAVARGALVKAAREDAPIPLGWAWMRQGAPTTDAKAALKGTMMPMAEAKGAALALMVEVLAAALTGGNFAYEASSFLDAKGAPPHTGQLLVLVAAEALGADAAARLGALAGRMAADGARLPGAGRMARRAEAQANGLTIPPKSWIVSIACLKETRMAHWNKTRDANDLVWLRLDVKGAVGECPHPRGAGGIGGASGGIKPRCAH